MEYLLNKGIFLYLIANYKMYNFPAILVRQWLALPVAMISNNVKMMPSIYIGSGWQMKIITRKSRAFIF